jgi:hypothetical protein
VPSLHELAEAARQDLMLCSCALDEAAARRGRDLLDVLTAPGLYWKLSRARKHRAAARRQVTALHEALHDRASLALHNPDLWSAIMRAVDALALSRWLCTEELAAQDIAPARTTVHILLSDLAELIGLLHELAWPDEMPESG